MKTKIEIGRDGNTGDAVSTVSVFGSGSTSFEGMRSYTLMFVDYIRLSGEPDNRQILATKKDATHCRFSFKNMDGDTEIWSGKLILKIDNNVDSKFRALMKAFSEGKPESFSGYISRESMKTTNLS